MLIGNCKTCYQPDCKNRQENAVCAYYIPVPSECSNPAILFCNSCPSKSTCSTDYRKQKESIDLIRNA